MQEPVGRLNAYLVYLTREGTKRRQTDRQFWNGQGHCAQVPPSASPTYISRRCTTTPRSDDLSTLWQLVGGRAVKSPAASPVACPVHARGRVRGGGCWGLGGAAHVGAGLPRGLGREWSVRVGGERVSDLGFPVRVFLSFVQGGGRSRVTDV